MNLTEQPHSRPDSKCKAASAQDRVFIIKQSAPLVIGRFQCPIEIDAGLAAQGVFNPIVIEKRLAVNPLPLIQGPTEDIGKELHAVVSIEFDTIARQMSVQEYGLVTMRSEEHTSELQSPCNLVCRLLLEKKKNKRVHNRGSTQCSVPDTITQTASPAPEHHSLSPNT